jgi:5-formyltetrahydrofolate cyclo-ligase|tara:strand:- start:750 stop:1316 length:567 start_codon:yes stop_codon:yes gene_type:complete
MKETKENLRTLFLEKRLKLSPTFRKEASLSIANQCLKLPIWELEYFHLFLPIIKKAEVNTSFISTLLQARNKHIVLPKVNFGDPLTHFLLTDKTKIIKNKWGISEPDNGIPITPSMLDVVFIPLLGYDTFGNRVGYGKGFYDNFLKNCKSNILKIGISFFEPVKKIQGIHPEDIPLNYCITPERIHYF